MFLLSRVAGDLGLVLRGRHFYVSTTDSHAVKLPYRGASRLELDNGSAVSRAVRLASPSQYLGNRREAQPRER
jgi:hypothetical protein